MATHDLRYIGRVNFTFLDYLNISGSIVLLVLAALSTPLPIQLMALILAGVVVVTTIYGGRTIARVEQHVEKSGRT